MHQFSMYVKERKRDKVMGIYITNSIKSNEKKLHDERHAIILQSFLTEIPVEKIL